ncbi:sodium:solute symporter family protein [Larsenimonas rhizosphaerae]|uniref:Sodium:solute symporter family protein n=1 Tax=Larsenimonas rhizosphaerae TaxID=2944682 RepID=A0AA41ZNW5_9GAMM|nr:sodium:solute symporter family protein [Larsenimonas rhizosphaerae]MCX2525388.1 sodium:solute symporter family protein [Larsenimonas rhizosphaerae]
MLNWALLIVSATILIGLSLYSMRVAGDQDESGFLVANNSLGPFVAAATLIATGYSGFVFIGSPGVAYEYGSLELFSNAFYTPAFLIATLFFANYLRRKARTLGSRTMPEYIAQTHSAGMAGRWLQGLVAVIIILLLSVFLVSQIKAIGLLVSGWLGLSPTMGALLITLLVVGYTMFGGLRAVAWTDAVMVLGMVLASCVIAYVVFVEIGVGELIARLDVINPELANPSSGAPYGDSPASALLLLPYAFLWAAALPFMSVRFLAIKQNVSMARVGIWVAILGLLLNFTPLAGLYAKAYFPDLASPDMAMPTFLAEGVSPLMSSVITLFILFAMKSTANSLMHTVSTALSYDLRAALGVHKGFTTTMTFNRLMVLIVGICGFVGMAYMPPVMILWLGILGNGTLMASLFGVTLCSTFWQGNSAGAFASIAAGFSVSAFLLLGTDLGWVQGPLYGCLASAACYVGVSLATRRALTPAASSL